MSLGKIKYENIILSPECIMMMNKVDDDNNEIDDEFVICFYLAGDENSLFSLGVDGQEMVHKIFETIWDRLSIDGYCDLNKFNEKGSYVDYGLLH